jgi:hypothetical protein
MMSVGVVFLQPVRFESGWRRGAFVIRIWDEVVIRIWDEHDKLGTPHRPSGKP